MHDQVVAIDPTNMTVTINLINGFSFGKPVWYMSMDTSIPLGAAIEHNTFAPLMARFIWVVTTLSPARLSASSSPPTALTAAQIHNGKACPRI